MATSKKKKKKKDTTNKSHINEYRFPLLSMMNKELSCFRPVSSARKSKDKWKKKKYQRGLRTSEMRGQDQRQKAITG